MSSPPTISAPKRRSSPLDKERAADEETERSLTQTKDNLLATPPCRSPRKRKHGSGIQVEYPG
jgi:hypothetical protein